MRLRGCSLTFRKVRLYSSSGVQTLQADFTQKIIEMTCSKRIQQVVVEKINYGYVSFITNYKGFT